MISTFIFGGVLAAILVAIAWIDWRHQIIPDSLNAILAVGGLVYQQVASPKHLLVHACMGVVVFASLWLLRRIHFSRTGRIGLGLGDVKMAGASAIWLSPLTFPHFVFAASITALVFMAGRHLASGNVSFETRQPFGPFLAVSLLAIWLAEQHLPNL